MFSFTTLAVEWTAKTRNIATSYSPMTTIIMMIMMHYVASRKVAGSIPDELTGFFN
jgi:hypothetical protein